MPDIVLTTLNARYWHTAFGLRYLLANMGDLAHRTKMMEFVINDRPVDIVAEILQQQPSIVGIGVYIWNVRPVTEVVALLKQLAPGIVVVLGGPEVSYETARQRITQLCDFVITGEADLAFAELCRSVLAEGTSEPKIQQASLPQMDGLRLPYALYSDEDIAHRVIYVEASRGCPFTCEFCLSALEIPVRQAKLTAFLDAMQGLLDRGARQFKFVDRTFNLNLRVSQEILQFFLERWCDDLFLHFEMIPDRLPAPLRELIARFPAGALQFEIGVQTFNHKVGELISRRQDNSVLEENFRFLRQQTGVHIHADLIVGLPGEDMESFGRGFDRLLALEPQEIQVGILKRLKGTPIVRHDEEYEMVYSTSPPFEILQTRHIGFESMMRLRHFARTWDLVGNSGNFGRTIRLVTDHVTSPFDRVLMLSEWLVQREGRLQGIALTRLAKYLFEFGVTECGLAEQQVAEAIWLDYTSHGRSDRPAFLRKFDLPPVLRQEKNARLPGRQTRHQTAARREE